MAIRELLPPREYLLNQWISHLPWTGLRVAGYSLLGVQFEAPETSTILLGTDVHNPRGIRVGSHSIIGRRCHLDGRGTLSIGRNVNISSYSRLITAGHDPYDERFRGYSAPITVEDRVWIATGATILAGVTIGHGAVVASGALVNRDVEPFSVVGGTPARVIGKRPQTVNYELNYRPNYV